MLRGKYFNLFYFPHEILHYCTQTPASHLSMHLQAIDMATLQHLALTSSLPTSLSASKPYTYTHTHKCTEKYNPTLVHKSHNHTFNATINQSNDIIGRLAKLQAHKSSSALTHTSKAPAILHFLATQPIV